MNTKENKQIKQKIMELIDELPEKDLTLSYNLLSAMAQKSCKTKQEDQNLRMYTLTELEWIFSVTHRTLLNWVKNGSLHVVKIGGKWRISEADLWEFALGRIRNY